MFHESFQLYKDIFASALKSGYDFLWILATESNKLLPAISVGIYTTEGEDEQSVHSDLSYIE